MQAINVGAITVLPIFDSTVTLTPDMFVVGDHATDWTAHAHLLDADGTLRMPVGAFVVQIGDRTIMLDAGVGIVDNDLFEGHELLDNLAHAGISRDQVDTIVMSHLHIDHCGWLEHRGAATFPNASIRVAAADWEYFVEQGHSGMEMTARLRTVQDHVDLVHADGTIVAPGMTTRLTPGHTPGHMSTVIASGEQRLIVLGDAVHCPAQLTETEWEFLYDVDRALATHTRLELLREADDPNTSVLPAHFPRMATARLLPATGERSWVLG